MIGLKTGSHEVLPASPSLRGLSQPATDLSDNDEDFSDNDDDVDWQPVSDSMSELFPSLPGNLNDNPGQASPA